MSAPVDFGPMGRVIESTLKALDQARGVGRTAAEEPEPPVGYGQAVDGQITVEAHTGGRLAQLRIDPLAMRLDSVKLAEAIVTAANAALADLQGKLRAGLVTPDLAALATQLKQVQQESTQQMGAFLTALTDTQARIAAAGR
jgi:DNA-binding protein YbaB